MVDVDDRFPDLAPVVIVRVVRAPPRIQARLPVLERGLEAADSERFPDPHDAHRFFALVLFGAHDEQARRHHHHFRARLAIAEHVTGLERSAGRDYRRLGDVLGRDVLGIDALREGRRDGET